MTIDWNMSFNWHQRVSVRATITLFPHMPPMGRVRPQKVITVGYHRGFFYKQPDFESNM